MKANLAPFPFPLGTVSDGGPNKVLTRPCTRHACEGTMAGEKVRYEGQYALIEYTRWRCDKCGKFEI